MTNLSIYGVVKYSKVGQAVEAAFSVFNTLGLSYDEAEDAASILIDQFYVENLAEKYLTPKRWRPLYAGVVKNNSIVRVRPNTFKGSLGKYNNRVGLVVNQKAGRGQIQFFLGNTTHWFSLEDLEYFL